MTTAAAPAEVTLAPQLVPQRLDDGKVCVVLQGNNNTNQELWDWLSTNFQNVSFAVGWNRRMYGMQNQPGVFSSINEKYKLLKIGQLPRAFRSPGGGLVPTPDFMPVCPVDGLKQLTDGSWSQFGQELVDHFGDPIDLGAIDIDLSGSQILQNTRGGAANDAVAIIQNKLLTNKVGSVSFFGDHAAARAVIQAHTDKINTLRIKNYFKGANPLSYNYELQSPKQVLQGQRFFLCKYTTTHLDQSTCCWKQITITGIGCFESVEKIKKYKKARTFIVSLLKDIGVSAGLKFIDKAAYETMIREKAGALGTYWGGIGELLEEVETDIPDYDRVDELEAAGEFVGPDDFGILKNKTKALASPEGQQSRRATKAYERAKTAVENHATKVKQSKDKIDGLKNDVEYYRTQIKNAESMLKSLNKDQEKSTAAAVVLEEEYTTYNTVLPDLETAAEEAKKKVSDLIASAVDSNSGTAFFERLKKTGIIVTDVVYHKKTDARQRMSLKGNAATIIQDETWTMNRLEFVTTKPIVITVDGHKNAANPTKVVGGPYEVKVQGAGPYPSMDIRLAKITGVFGSHTEGNHLWVKPHPHTNRTNMKPTIAGLENFCKTWQSCCLGDATPAISNAMKNNSPEMVLIAAMSWLSSANSSDSWGKHAGWFPSVEDVDTEGRWNQPDVPEEEVPDPVAVDPELDETINTMAQTTIARLAIQTGLTEEQVADVVVTQTQQPDTITTTSGYRPRRERTEGR